MVSGASGGKFGVGCDIEFLIVSNYRIQRSSTDYTNGCVTGVLKVSGWVY